MLTELRTCLLKQGTTCSEIDQHSHYGWYFDAQYNEKTIWCLIQNMEPWSLITELQRSL